ncbi:MAG: hypothetical protein ACO3KD_09205, partial [Gaiellales bacterium]
MGASASQPYRRRRWIAGLVLVAVIGIAVAAAGGLRGGDGTPARAQSAAAPTAVAATPPAAAQPEPAPPAEAPAPPRSAGMSARVISRPAARTVSRRQAFTSWRTLPGQSYAT